MVVRGVGGSTGCPECKVVSISKCRRGRECGQFFGYQVIENRIGKRKTGKRRRKMDRNRVVRG